MRGSRLEDNTACLHDKWPLRHSLHGEVSYWTGASSAREARGPRP
jgi:hypothetical protein